MRSLIDATKAPDYPAEICLVISNRPEAAGLNFAKKAGIETVTIDHKAYKTRESFERVLHEALTKAKIEIVCCAGFMRILTPWFISRWEGRIMNIHPSLLPKYKGLHTHQRALDAGDGEHGCTVHWVSVDLDAGDIILQNRIAIIPGDTVDTLAQRLLPVEWKTYSQALEKIAKKRLSKS